MTTTAVPHRLRVERRPAPLGVDPSSVRFDWLAPEDVATQSACRIRVAAADDLRGTDGFDALLPSAIAWDSGVVESSATSDVPYAGPRLEPRTRYRWSVRVRDAAGEWSAWSDPGTFETAIEAWSGSWLAPAGPAYEEVPAPAPVFRTTFAVDSADETEDREVVRASLAVAAGGTCETRLNGERVTDAAIEPGVTDYEERVLAVTRDVTDALRPGENGIALICGRERYAMTAENAWAWHETPWQRDHPEVLAELTITYADGSRDVVATDDTWTVGPGATRFDCLYGGDEYDARDAEPWSDPALVPAEAERGAESEWTTATAVDGPAGAIDAQLLQPVEPVGTIEPDAVEELDDGSYVVDFGEVLAGWVRLRADEPAGTEVVVAHGEKRDDDGSVPTEQSHLEVPFQTDVYVCGDGEPEPWEPRFSYKGFRYVQIEGLSSPPALGSSPADGRGGTAIEAVVAHNTIETHHDSEFDCADDLLNQIHENTRRALLSNHHWQPTDTPAYEKHGWTGDAQITAETALYNFDVLPLYRKWLRDVADAQRETGELPPFCPTSDWGYSEGAFDEPFTAPIPAWDAAYVLMPWWAYRYAGDRELLAEHYDGMCRLVGFLDAYREGGVLDEGLGDWFPPGHGEITWNPPEGPAITSTAYFYRMAELLAEIADVLGRADDAAAYAALARRTREEFTDAFLDRERSVYATGEVEEYRQTSNLFPLAFGMVPSEHREAVVENLVADVRDAHDGHLNTGILGTKYLLPVLADEGHVDLAYRVATRRDYPSWGDWIEQGLTSFCEAWESEARSRNHHMFGSVDEWFFSHLVGVRPAAPGFETVAFEPHAPTDLDAAAATVDTVRGPVDAAWERVGGDGGDSGDVQFDLAVPPTAVGRGRLPGRVTSVEGTPVAAGETPDVRGPDGDRTMVDLPPGEWSIRTSPSD